MDTVLSLNNSNFEMDPQSFIALLAQWPERVFALRLAMSRVIKPTSVVLDAGCGSLGVLAIIAAQLGASRVVAVDVVDLDLARKLAKENGVADRIDFIQDDLHNVQLPVESFDVIIGMIYYNVIELDLPQHNLMRVLIERHACIDTVFIPNKVRYSVTGCYYLLGKVGALKSNVELEKYIENAEGYTGITLSACREMIDCVPQLPESFNALVRQDRPGYINRSNMTLLTERKLFTEICYNDRLDQYTYPESFSLPIIHPGRLNAVIWQQDIIFDDILIRTIETLKFVTPKPMVEPGMIIKLYIGLDWREKLSIAIDGKV